MTVLNVAMFGSDELAKQIAKATDQRDVHTYVHKELTDGVAKIISIIRPARYPEPLRPLLNAISAGRVGIIEINAIDATLGEVLVAFASSSIIFQFYFWARIFTGAVISDSIFCLSFRFERIFTS